MTRTLKLMFDTSAGSGAEYTSIDLLSETGCYTTNFDTVIQDFKSGGTWVDSPLSDNRYPVNVARQNLITTLKLTIAGTSADNVLATLRSVINVLDKSMAYWGNKWQTHFGYLEAKGDAETNTRYAIIVGYKLDAIPSVYTSAFEDGILIGNSRATSALVDVTIAIEHSPWLSSKPGSGTATQVSNTGRAATTAREVFVASKSNTAALTHIYVYNGSTYTSNQVAATAFNLLPATPAANNAIYFGNSGSNPFCSLVFDIGTAETGISAAVWEYYNGSWVTLITHDNTNDDGGAGGVPFDTTGVKSVSWNQPTDWAAVSINSVSAFWVRMRVVTASGATAPTQQNRIVYTVLWPYIEIAANQVAGDMPAAMKALIWNESGDDVGAMSLGIGNMVCGLRRTSRGSSFNAFINTADEQNAAGITVTLPGGDATFVNRLSTPTGRAVKATGTSVLGGRYAINIAIASTLSGQYIGSYHAYVRADIENSSTRAATMSLTMSYGGVTMFSKTKTLSDIEDAIVVDFGGMRILPDGIDAANDFADITFVIDMASDGDIYVIDLVLIPSDEWICSTNADTPYNFALRDASSAAYLGRVLDIDAVGLPRVNKRAIVFKSDAATAVARLPMITNGSPMLSAGVAQRLWFLCWNSETLSTASQRSSSILNSVQVWTQNKYNIGRGAV